MKRARPSRDRDLPTAHPLGPEARIDLAVTGALPSNRPFVTWPTPQQIYGEIPFQVKFVRTDRAQ